MLNVPVILKDNQSHSLVGNRGVTNRPVEFVLHSGHRADRDERPSEYETVLVAVGRTNRNFAVGRAPNQLRQRRNFRS